MHDLDAFIPGDRRRALAANSTLAERPTGAALFADISGFTPLTEALAKELGPQRGAEELTRHLDRVFETLIDDLDHYGGEVIYFSGDAITCWLDDDDGVRATACALAMQQTMGALREVVTPAGARIELAMKVAIAVGSARRFVVGEPEIQLIDVLAGRLIDALAAAERCAKRGEVVLDQSAIDALGDRVTIRELRGDAAGDFACGVVATLAARPEEAIEAEPVDVDPLPEDTARRWLLPDVYERLRQGRAEFLAELRPGFPLFVHFGGIDYDVDEHAVDRLDRFVRAVQRTVTAYGGNVLHITLGDKGAYLYAIFGAPHAHEDDARRTASAALELLRMPEQGTGIGDIRIGIAYGRLHSGMYGHPNRRTFTCFGDGVNLAARLMSAASTGQILATDAVRRAAGETFAWEPRPAVTVRGKADPVAIHALVGASTSRVSSHAATASALLGRTSELAWLDVRLRAALAGGGHVAGVCGEAGIGKSRLIAEFTGKAALQGVLVARGECQSYGRNASYLAWRDVWTTLFGIDRTASDDVNVERVEARLAAIDPTLVPRAPLLATLLDLPMPENDLTSQFDAKLRKTSLEGLLFDCLKARAANGPLLIVLEDCHWLDALSRDLLEVFARSLSTLPVLILVAYRPASGDAGGVRIEVLPNAEELRLGELAAGDVQTLIRRKLSSIVGEAEDVPVALIDMVGNRSQGNPFYVEELLNYIEAVGVDPRDPRALAKLELPDSLHSLILSRVDKLDEGSRQVLKVASVLGREFTSPTLPGVYPKLGNLSAVENELGTLGVADLIGRSDTPQTYAFKHIVTREVAYESMPFAFRSMLHERAGDYIEETQEEAIERHLDLLAYHYWHSENRDRKREYLGRAGAAAQAAYANDAAIDYFERLAPLLSQGSRVDVLLKLAKVLELVGNWRRAEEVDKEALELAESLDDGLRRAACQAALAEVVRKQGRFPEAFQLLNRAARGFAAFGDEAGVARVLHLTGTVAAQRGDYDKAQASYRKSLQIREKIGDKASMASLLSNLGVIAEYRGDYDGAREFHDRALALRESVGDRWAIGVSMTNLGNIAVLQKRYGEAREWFEKAMRINREVGDAWMVANLHNNLGNATRGLGEFEAAREHYAESLRTYRDYDDRWSLAFLLEDIGILAALEGDPVAALELIGATDAIREAIGAPRAPSLAEDMERQIAASIVGLSDEERTGHRTRGRALEAGAAIERARTVCVSTSAVV